MNLSKKLWENNFHLAKLSLQTRFVQNLKLGLLPEAIFKLDRSVAPLRRNSGKLIILDGRANKRKWGRLLIESIQPSKKIKYMLPFD